MGLFDSIKKLAGEITGKEPEAASTRRRDLYQAFDRTGTEIRRLVKVVRDCIAQTKQKYGVTMSGTDEALAKCREAEEFLAVTSYTEDDFRLYGIDEDSPWVTTRSSHAQELSGLAKTVSHECAKLEQCAKQRAEILAWESPLLALQDLFMSQGLPSSFPLAAMQTRDISLFHHILRAANR
jgi:hypothetical protein